MARRKAEVQLQQEIETQEEWEEMLSKEGLTVVDVYQEWAGPCSAMISNLRRMKNELGDDLLKFATAKADTIDALEKYRGRCEPCFLYIASGMLVSVVRGANSPMVIRMITEQLAQEHKVLDGAAERKEIRDPLLAELDNREEEDEERSDEEDSERQIRYKGEIINFDDEILDANKEARQKEVTVAIIKPDAVKAGKTEDIMSEMRAAGIEIVADEERTLTEDEAREFYSHMREQDFYEDLVQFMCSGPCHVLVLTKGSTGENIIQEWRHLIGPTTVEEARENAPQSLRAKYGSGSFMNALHGSDSPDRASRELAFFFPNLKMPTVQGAPKLQRTLALIRPDAFKNNKDEILQKIQDAGFQVALQKVMHLTKEQAEEFYKEHQGQEYYDELTTRMSSGPLLALGLAREDAVESWRHLLGPKLVSEAKEQAPESLRAQYSVDETDINQLHGSDSPTSAEKELQFFFPMQQTIAAIKPDAYGTKDEIIDKIHEAGFRIAARKETKLTRELAEQFYADQKDKEFFDDLVEHMVSGPTQFMVLSREDAVEGWRSLLGPTDPEKAKEEAPNTIRAIYGKDVKMNAVHGSSNSEQAKDSIKKIFGDLEFNPDGTVKVEKQHAEEQQHAPSEEQDVQQQQHESSEAEQSQQQQAEQQDQQAQETEQGQIQEAEQAQPEEGDKEEAKDDADASQTKAESTEDKQGDASSTNSLKSNEKSVAGDEAVEDEHFSDDELQDEQSAEVAQSPEAEKTSEETPAEGEQTTGQIDKEDAKSEKDAQQESQQRSDSTEQSEQQPSLDQQTTEQGTAETEQQSGAEQQTAVPEPEATSAEQDTTSAEQEATGAEQEATGAEQEATGAEQDATGAEQQSEQTEQQSAVEQPATEQPATEQPATEQQATEQQATEQQVTEQQATEQQQNTEQSEQETGAQDTEQQAQQEQTALGDQSEQQTTDEQQSTTEQKPADEQQSTTPSSKPDDEKPKDGEQKPDESF